MASKRIDGLRKRDWQMLQLLISNSFITNTMASRLGIGSPTKCISNLRAIGFNIQDRQVTGIDQFGDPCRHKEYFYVQGKS